jgi:hypothetical protein
MREICERCKKKPAKNFICQIMGSEQRTLDLCDDCLRAHDAANPGKIPLDGTQTCYYCGSPAQAASRNDEWEQRVRGRPFHSHAAVAFNSSTSLLWPRWTIFHTRAFPKRRMRCLLA